MKIDLSDVKEWDEVFHSRDGFQKVLSNKDGAVWVHKNAYNYSGRWIDSCKHPTLFHSAQECADYFAWVAEQANKPELPDIPKGAVVAVTDEFGDGWYADFFETFDQNSRPNQYSITCDKDYWTYWKWVDPNGKVWTNAGESNEY